MMRTAVPPPPIVARRVRVDFGQLPEARDKPFDWYDGDAAQTEIFHALSITFPAGETFFIDSVLHYGARIKAEAPKLWKQVRLFFRQEGMHTALHEKLAFVSLFLKSFSLFHLTHTLSRHLQMERARSTRVWPPDGRP